MRKSRVSVRIFLPLVLVLIMLLPGLVNAYPEGIGGEQQNGSETIDDVAKEGCLCHGAEPSNSVMILLVGVPHTWAPDQAYDMRLEIVGGPATDL